MKNPPWLVEELELVDFRNFAALEFEPSSGLSLLVGPNAQGKTNLLEAFGLLSSMRLLRTSRDEEAIRYGSDRARASARLASGHRIEVALQRRSRKRATLDGQAPARASDLIGRLPSVTISPQDEDVVLGEPSARRLFLDMALCQLRPAYLRHLAAYKRALEQRNALLKRAQEDHVPVEAFEPWEVAMGEHGDAVRSLRIEFVGNLDEEAQRTHAELASGEALRLRYEEREPGALTEALAERRALDVRRGTSGSGPHRDELQILIEAREARAFGSQGQQRTALLSLKIAQFCLSRDRLSGPPLLLLDDVFSDLDKSRREKLTKFLLESGAQTILTCTEAEHAGAELAGSARIFPVRAGTILTT